MSEPKYYVWSIEHHAWWPASRAGYVESLLDAGRFSYAEAKAIVTDANVVETNECMIAAEDVEQLTPSQVLALTDIVAHYMLYPGSSDTFVDVVNHVDTHIEALLAHLMRLRGMR